MVAAMRAPVRCSMRSTEVRRGGMSALRMTSSTTYTTSEIVDVNVSQSPHPNHSMTEPVNSRGMTGLSLQSRPQQLLPLSYA
jgi:hypothetical protein